MAAGENTESMKSRKQTLIILLALLAALGSGASVRAQASQPASAPTQSDSKETKQSSAPKKTAAPPQSSATPADSTSPAAKTVASPKAPPAANATTVWVNTATGVYHQPGSRWYGKTKQGKYMTEADAIKAGYHAAGKS